MSLNLPGMLVVKVLSLSFKPFLYWDIGAGSLKPSYAGAGRRSKTPVLLCGAPPVGGTGGQWGVRRDRSSLSPAFVNIPGQDRWGQWQRPGSVCSFSSLPLATSGHGPSEPAAPVGPGPPLAHSTSTIPYLGFCFPPPKGGTCFLHFPLL